MKKFGHSLEYNQLCKKVPQGKSADHQSLLPQAQKDAQCK